MTRGQIPFDNDHLVSDQFANAMASEGRRAVTLFFTPSSGRGWTSSPGAGSSLTDGPGPVTDASGRLRLVPVAEGVGRGDPGPAASASAGWRDAFPAFRRATILREALTSAAAATLLLAFGFSLAQAALWALVLLVAIPAAAAATGAYGWRSLGEGSIEQRATLRAGGVVATALMVLAYLGFVAVPVPVVAVATPAAVATAMIARHVSSLRLVARRERGEAMLRTVLVGSAASARDLLAQIRQAPGAGYEVVGWCGPADELGAVEGVPALGELPGIDRVGGLALEQAADVVMLVGEHDAESARRASWSLAGTNASLVVVPVVAEVAPSRVRVRPNNGLWSLQLDVAERPRRVLGKRMVDRLVGAALLALASLILLPVLVAVRFTSPGPALYRQQRVGRNGELFTMWKVRSMYVDADARLAELAGDDEGNGLLFKMRSDPRITPIGRMLRRLSIDELPQLYNVVRGEMSLVGPRPALPSEVACYVADEPKRLAVKPGLTGLWQVSGRSDLSREESMRLDLRYVDNWSLGLDAAILRRTFRAVAGGRGAY